MAAYVTRSPRNSGSGSAEVARPAPNARGSGPGWHTGFGQARVFGAAVRTQRRTLVHEAGVRLRPAHFFFGSGSRSKKCVPVGASAGRRCWSCRRSMPSPSLHRPARRRRMVHHRPEHRSRGRPRVLAGRRSARRPDRSGCPSSCGLRERLHGGPGARPRQRCPGRESAARPAHLASPRYRTASVGGRHQYKVRHGRTAAEQPDDHSGSTFECLAASPGTSPRWG